MTDWIHRLDAAVGSGSARLLENVRGAGPAVAIRGSLFPVGLALFLFPLVCILLGSAGFLLGISLTRWHPIAALPLAGCATYLACGRNVGKAVACFCLFLLITGILLALFSLPFYDEGDGVAYHKPAAIMMADGWNPVRDPENTRPFDGMVKPANDNDGYARGPVWWFPKAQWIFVAQIYLLTGNLDAGNFSNGVYALVSFAIAYWGLSVLFRLSGLERFLASFVIAANTTVVIQVTSGMIDTQVGSLMTILLFSLAGYAKTRDARFLPFIAGSIPLLCNVKTTGAVYAGIALFLFVVPMAWTAWRKGERQDRKLLASIAASLLLTLLVGVNPYLTNIANHSNPLHPFAGGGANDPIRALYIDRPGSIFHGTTGIQRFVVSHFLAQPRTICGKEFSVFEIDPRRVLSVNPAFNLVYAEIGAFGPWFSIGLAASLVLLFFVRDRYAWWLLLVVASTVLVQPHSYIGRYVPQLWLVPPVVLCALRSQSFAEEASRGFRVMLLYYALLGVLAFGCVKIATGHFRDVASRTANEMYAIRLLAENPFLKIGRDSAQVGMEFCRERVARDCLDNPLMSDRDPMKDYCRKSLWNLRYAPVFREIDPGDPGPKRIRPVVQEEGTLLSDIASLRMRQLKKAWGGEKLPVKPGKG